MLLAPLPRDSVMFRETFASILEHLRSRRGIVLDESDSSSIDYVYSAFYDGGPGLTYSSNASRGFGSRGMPSYRLLMTATDPDGVNQSYLGSDEIFETLKEMQERNLIVPVVGDFAGPKALRAVGEWLRQQQASVDVFYVSNVEQYLFQQPDAWRQFYDNVNEMPRDRNALFVRSVSTRGWRSRQHPYARSSSVTSGIDEVLHRFRSGQLQTYGDVIALSR
jgi:hypothetical protein